MEFEELPKRKEKEWRSDLGGTNEVVMLQQHLAKPAVDHHLWCIAGISHWSWLAEGPARSWPPFPVWRPGWPKPKPRGYLTSCASVGPKILMLTYNTAQSYWTRLFKEKPCRIQGVDTSSVGVKLTCGLILLCLPPPCPTSVPGTILI